MTDQTASRPPSPSALAPFRYPDFRLLWGATLVSNFGGLVQAVGAAWLMTQLTDSATLIALVQASNTLPIMLLALASGALADIFDRKAILMFAQCFMAAVSLALAIVAWQGWLTPWLLLVFTFLIGAGQALYNPPWQASMGDLVPRADLPAAVTLNSVGFNLMRSVGPAAGGFIVAAFGAAAAFAVNAASYVPLLGALLRWRPNIAPRTAPPEEFLPAVAAGLRYVLLSPNLTRVIGRGALFGFAAVSVLALLPAGASWVLALSLFNVTVQLSTPRWVVARALALYQTATFGGMAAGSWVWGSVAGAHGLGDALTAAGLVLLAGAVVGFWFKVPEFGTADLDPANRFREPALRLDLRGRSGPIMVMVDYRIAQQDTAEFLRLMGLRRNIRRRDGARNWALLRDLEHPDLWSESYHIATWDEYVRHNLRRTKSDAEITVALRALHRGEGDPLVHRMIERHSVGPEDDLPLIGKMDV